MIDKNSTVASDLWPYLLPRIERLVSLGVESDGGGSVVSGAPTPHALSSTHHSGILADSQGPQFLKLDGSRALAGNLSVDSGITIDGIDISAHAADPDAHHARATGGDGIDVTGQDVAVDSTVVRITRDLTAGAGLVGGGTLAADRTFAVGQGDGLTVGADAVALTTPGTLDVSTTNASAGNHTHAVTASSDVSAGVAALLKSTAAGGLGLASAFTTGAVDVGQGLTAGNTGFRVIYHTHDYPHTHVVVNPTGAWNLDEQFGLDVDDNLLVRGWIVGKHAIQVAGAKMLLHFDGPAPYETNFKGNPTGHMGQVGTQTGGVIYREGKFNKALSIGRAVTNLITNPSFEVNTTGWAAAGDTVIVRISGGTVGAYCLWIQCYTAYNAAYTGSLSLTNGVSYTLSFDVKAVSGTTANWVVEANRAGGYASQAFTPTSEWQRVTFTFVANATAADHVINIYNTTSNFGSISIDAVQLEANAFATPYCDGSLDDAWGGTEHIWSGTAHASTSSRNAGFVTYDDASLTDLTAPMTIMAWIKPFQSVSYQPVITKTNAGETEGWELANYSGWLHIIARNPTVQVGNGVGACALTMQAWQHIAVTYDGATLTLYLDGALATSIACTSSVATSSPIRVGYRPSDGSQFDGYIDDVGIITRALSADEIRAIYESNAPVFAEASTWQWRAGRNRIYADAEGLWGYGASGAAILGLYAGDDLNPSATKSWGGVNLSEGDFLLGRYGAADGGWLHFDQDLVGGDPGLKFGYADKTVLLLDSGGASLDGVLDITTTGGIYQGTGSFASPTTGLKLWNDSGVGRLGGYNGGTAQWYANTNGKLYAGAGAVVIENDGIAFESDVAGGLPDNHYLQWWTDVDSKTTYPNFYVGNYYASLASITDITTQSRNASNTQASMTLRALAHDAGGGALSAQIDIFANASTQTVTISPQLNVNNEIRGSAFGLRLTDDGGNLGIFIADGGKVSIGGGTDPKSTFHVGEVTQVVSVAWRNNNYYDAGSATDKVIAAGYASKLYLNNSTGEWSLENLTASASAEASVTFAKPFYVTKEGNAWFIANVSALSFTDRTKGYEGDALTELSKIKAKDGKIDHDTLPAFARSEQIRKTVEVIDGKEVETETVEVGRDLGAMISMLIVAVQQLATKIDMLEAKN